MRDLLNRLSEAQNIPLQDALKMIQDEAPDIIVSVGAANGSGFIDIGTPEYLLQPNRWETISRAWYNKFSALVTTHRQKLSTLLKWAPILKSKSGRLLEDRYTEFKKSLNREIDFLGKSVDNLLAFRPFHTRPVLEAYPKMATNEIVLIVPGYEIAPYWIKLEKERDVQNGKDYMVGRPANKVIPAADKM